MPEVILWDVMDTLVRDPFFTHMADFFGLSFDELLRRKHPTAWGKFELGKLDEQGLFDQFFADGTPIDGPAFKRCVAEAYAWIDGIESLLIELKAGGVPMHALSNYPPWYQLIEDRLRLSRYVDLTFFSCDTGVRKPAAGAYLGACRKKTFLDAGFNERAQLVVVAAALRERIVGEDPFAQA